MKSVARIVSLVKKEWFLIITVLVITTVIMLFQIFGFQG